MSDSPRKHRGVELYAAGIATFIGVLALIVSAYTAYVQRQQLRAQVWPRLQIESSDVKYHYVVINQGTGPARVTGMRVTLGALPVRSWAMAWKLAGLPANRGLVLSTLHNAVLPAGKEFEIAWAQDDDVSRRGFLELRQGVAPVEISLCYCSVLDDCWLTSTRHEEPIAITACPIPSTERFKD